MSILLDDLFLETSVHNLKMFLTLLLLVLGTQISVTQKPASESADVVLLIDSSDVLGKKAFSSVKSFVNRMINSLPVGPNKYRLAVVQYSDNMHIEFQLNEYGTKNPMLNHLKKNFLFRGGSLRTGNAIQKVHETFFKPPRKDRNQIVVVSTSGASEDDVERPAKRLQADGIKIIALGIQNASPQELQRVATHSFYYNFHTPKDLVTFSQNMSKVIEAAIQLDSGMVFSTTIPPSVTQSPHNESIEVCPGDSVADLAFVVDEGVSSENANHITEFLRKTVRSLEVHQECIRIALVAYSTEPQIISFLNTSTDKAELLREIQSFSPKKGKANLGAAINVTRRRIFAERTGSRRAQAVEQIATIITHRPSDDNVSEAATLLRRKGVTVFAMSLKGANYTQLSQIASHPPKRNVVEVAKFSELTDQTKTFKKKLFNQIQKKLYVQSEIRNQLRTGCEETEKADIYFLIDGSSSIHYLDFTDMKNFMMEVAKLFTIGSEDVRFGVVQYSNSHKVEFELDYYTNIANLKKAINNIGQLTGDTYTGEALKALPPLFEKARKQRSSQVPCHLIVLTDGEAHDIVKIPAEALRKAKVNIYAIGVREANKTQLLEIAGSESRVYFVQQFDSLKEIKNDVVRDICSEEACKELKADIMFLVDSSGSIGPENFQKMKTFMVQLVNKSDIGLDQVHIGVVQFSGTNKEEFPLDRYTTQNDIVEAIGRMSLIGENTLTGGALQFVSDYFKPAKGARPHVKKILILITDGEAQDEVKIPAEALRKDGIIIYAVGVFNAIKQQLEEISGKPEMVFYVENFDVLEQIESDIIFGVCSPPEDCKKMNLLDVVFVIDSSRSIGDNYGLMKNFMIDLVNKSDVGKDNVQFGALKYSNDPQVLFYLNDYSTKSDIIGAIQSDTLLDQNTYTAKALRHSEALFTEQHGSRIRRNVPQILIVITDGESQDWMELDEVSKRLRSHNIDIYAVGIKGAKIEELLTMAGSKEKQFFVNNFQGLENVSTKLSKEMCNSSKPECKIHGEIIFLIDGSLSTFNYSEKMKSFLKELLDQMVYNSNIRIGMAQFSDKYQEEFQLGDHQNKSELKDKIDKVSIMKGRRTYVGNALRRVKTFFKSPKQRVVRDVTKQMLVVVTDGISHDDVAQPAEDLRKEGVEIYAVGVGKVNHEKLQRITGSSDRKYTTDDFSLSSDIQKRLITKMCDSDIKATCFVDVVLGFDISSQKTGDHLFHEHGQLEAILPGILKGFTSESTVSCNRGTNTQFSVAIPMESSNLQVDPEKILRKLREVVINKPSHLDVRFLDTLWNSFQNLTDNQKRSKVLLLFSDGLDDDVTVLGEKSKELRKQGLDGLITIALKENLDNLAFIEFGKGFGYNNQDTIYTHNLASGLLEYVDRIAERTCCCVYCKCPGEEGPIGIQGIMGTKGSNGTDGSRGHFGEEGVPGPPGNRGKQGKQGYKGCQGIPGQKGVRGVTGEKGELGTDAVDGINGEEGSRGLPGLKGEKGNPGQVGSSGPRGLPGDHGQKGFQGNPGNSGVDNGVRGERGPKGVQGSKGERGSKGSTGLAGSQGNTGAEGRRGRPGPPGKAGIPGPDGLQGEQGFHGPPGTAGIPGLKGEKGHSGNEGPEGNVGVTGPKGNQGKPGSRGNNGEPGDPGEKGKRGPRGQRGPRGEEGTAGYGRPGIKGSKGQEGFLGYIGMQGEAGEPGLPGEPGRKGNRGRMGLAGKHGGKGAPGDRGYPGHPGAKGAKGLASFSPCEVIEYVRGHSPCWKETQECPVYPTELVFALDASQDVTPRIFEQMREIIVAIVNDTKIRESNCPVGARVAVVSYNLAVHHLIRFSDFHTKNRMLQEIQSLSYQRSTDRRDIGESMRFVARSVFKRTLPSPNVRKIAVFFSNGQSSNTASINTAVLEFSALDILPVVIAFKNIPEVNRAFEMDDSGLFQVINIHQGRDYVPALQRLSCILCYDKCRPNESCLRVKTSSPQTYMDAAFILENSRKTSPAEFEKLKHFLSAAFDNFHISSDPKNSLIGDRVAVVSHAPLEFRLHSQKSPVRTEFEFLSYTSRGEMKRHIQESVQQMSGAAAVGHAIQWTISNIFSEAPNQRKYKAIFVISAGETSQWDKEVLRDAAARAKCQGFVVFVLSLGHEFNAIELEELASLPLEHHLIQLGRVHKADLGYAVKFLKSFLHLIRSGINSYPPVHLRRRCAEIIAQSPVYVPQHLIRTFAIDEFVQSGARPVETDSDFDDDGDDDDDFSDLRRADSELPENLRT